MEKDNSGVTRRALALTALAMGAAAVLPPTGSAKAATKADASTSSPGRSYKVFLTGGTGYLGTVVRRHLLEAGHVVTALTRKPRSAPDDPSNLKWVQGDFADTGLMEHSAAEADAVIHIGAFLEPKIEELDAGVLHAVAKAYERSGRVFITTSASGVGGDSGQEPRDKSWYSPKLGRPWRVAHDNEVTALNKRGMRGVVIRPGYIYGEAGGNLSDDIRVARETGKSVYLGDGQQLSSGSEVNTLAKLYLLALTNSAAHGIYNAVSDEVIRAIDIAKGVALFCGPNVELVAESEEAARKRRGDFATYVDVGLQNKFASSNRVRRELGWEPKSLSILADLLTGSYANKPLQAYKRT